MSDRDEMVREIEQLRTSLAHERSRADTERARSNRLADVVRRAWHQSQIIRDEFSMSGEPLVPSTTKPE